MNRGLLSTKKVVTEVVLNEALLARNGTVKESVADVARRHNLKPNTLAMHVLRYTRTSAAKLERRLRRAKAKEQAMLANPPSGEQPA